MRQEIIVPKSRGRLPLDIKRAETAIWSARRPEQLRPLEAKLEQAENLMRESGLYSRDQIRKINEVRMWAFWKLGKLLKGIERSRHAGTGRGHKGEKTKGGARPAFSSFVAALDPPLGLTSAKERQRVGAMPDKAMEKAIAAAHKVDEDLTISGLLRTARPWWQQENRRRKHRIIAVKAEERHEDIGPFPLLYVDPPWSFNTYNWTGMGSAPDMHYPTLTEAQIISYETDGKTISELAADDAALFMWCTSSNLDVALRVMKAWGFTFSTSAVWDKMKPGLGLVFINWHEILLYGTRGKMPGPLYKPPSIFHIARGEHSAKPPEIRVEIEKMFPHFNNPTLRLELFARGEVDGWTCRGNEAVEATGRTDSKVLELRSTGGH